MSGTSRHFSKTIAFEAMRLMDEKDLSLAQAFEVASERMSHVPAYEPPQASDHLAIAEPGESD